MLSLDQIRATAKGGYLKLDGQGGLRNVGKHGGRKVVQIGLAASQEAKQAAIKENRTVISKFVKAIASDRRYGLGPSEMARTELRRHIDLGKPLGERAINRILAQLDRELGERDSGNRDLADVYSNPLRSDQDAGPNINTAWDQLRRAEECEQLPDLDPSNHFCRRAMQSIRQEILALGDGGKHIVSDAEAQQIAAHHLRRLLDHVAMDAATLGAGKNAQPALDQIRQTVKGGYLKLDSQGEFVAAKKLQGEAADQAISAATEGARTAAAKDNRAVIDKFIEAIGSDQRYGADFAQAARAELQGHVASGKPLGEAAINRVLAKLDSQISAQDSSNHAMAARFSNPLGDHQDTEPNISSEWRQLRQGEPGKAHLPEISPNNYFARRALETIEKEILALGDGGKHKVTEAEAQQIAAPHIGRLADRLAMVTSALSADEPNLGEEDLAHQSDDRHISDRHKHIRQKNGLLLGELINNSEQMAEMEMAARAQAGLARRSSDSLLSDGQDVQMAMEVAEAFRKQAPAELVPSQVLKEALQAKMNGRAAAIKSLQDHANNTDLGVAGKAALASFVVAEPSIRTKEDIDALVAAKRPLLDHVASYRTLGQAAKAELGRIALGDPRLETTKDLDALVAAIPACQRFCETAADPSNSLANAYVHYRNSSGVISADKADYAFALLGAEVRSGRANVSALDLKDAWRRLTSDEGQQLKSGVLWLGRQHSQVAGAEQLGGEVSDFMAGAIKGLERQLPLEPEDLAQKAYRLGSIEGEQDVPDSAYNVFRDLNVAIPTPYPMGRSKEGVFSERFQQRYMRELNAELAKEVVGLAGDIDESMSRDLHRADYAFGEAVPGPYPPGTKERQTKAALDAFFEGHEQAKLIISRVTHQGLWAPIIDARHHKDGPIDDPMMNRTDLTEQNYRVWRGKGTGDYFVQADIKLPVSTVYNEDDTTNMKRTNLNESNIRCQARFRIPRDSIDNQRVAKAELEAPLSYSYKIVPA